MSDDPQTPRDERAGQDEGDEEATARRSRDTGGDAEAAASIDEREALAAEGDGEEPPDHDED